MHPVAVSGGDSRSLMGGRREGRDGDKIVLEKRKMGVKEGGRLDAGREESLEFVCNLFSKKGGRLSGKRKKREKFCVGGNGGGGKKRKGTSTCILA